jgi:TonB family protein
MKIILVNILVLASLLALGCSGSSRSVTNIDKNKSEPAQYFIGDTSGYASRPTGFVALYVAPWPIKRVEPQCPEYAKINNIEGNVFIDLCITKVGTVRGAVVKKTDNEIFNKPSLEAAIQWKFTPAMAKDSLPMENWYSVPFRFRNSNN